MAAALWGARIPASILLAQCEAFIADGRLDEAMSLADEHAPDADRTPDRLRWQGQYVRGLIHAIRGDAPGAIEEWQRLVHARDRRGCPRARSAPVGGRGTG